MLSRWFLAHLIFSPWRWRRYVPPKRRLTLNVLHGVLSQKMVLFITTAVRTSDLRIGALCICTVAGSAVCVRVCVCACVRACEVWHTLLERTAPCWHRLTGRDLTCHNHNFVVWIFCFRMNALRFENIAHSSFRTAYVHVKTGCKKRYSNSHKPEGTSCLLP
jgi:hypothetical protein